MLFAVVWLRYCEIIVMLDEQPGVGFLAVLDAYERKFAFELFAVQAELEVACMQPGFEIFLSRFSIGILQVG